MFVYDEPVSGQTLYGYVLNDPVNWVDSQGLGRSLVRPPSNNSAARRGTGPYGGYFGNPLNSPVMRNDYTRPRSEPNANSPFRPKPEHNPKIIRDHIKKIPGNNPWGDNSGPPNWDDRQSDDVWKLPPWLPKAPVVVPPSLSCKK